MTNRSETPGKDAFRGTTPTEDSYLEPAIALVPPGGIWEGQIAVIGETLIEGRVNGSLRGPGKLIVGTQAQIEGVIDCEDLRCAGHITGQVVVRGRAALAAGTRLDGDLETAFLELDDDAVWNGLARIGG